MSMEILISVVRRYLYCEKDNLAQPDAQLNYVIGENLNSLSRRPGSGNKSRLEMCDGRKIATQCVSECK